MNVHYYTMKHFEFLNIYLVEFSEYTYPVTFMTNQSGRTQDKISRNDIIGRRPTACRLKIIAIESSSCSHAVSYSYAVLSTQLLNKQTTDPILINQQPQRLLAVSFHKLSESANAVGESYLQQAYCSCSSRIVARCFVFRIAKQGLSQCWNQPTIAL